MPYTISHVAAVLPLRNKKFDFAALVVGAMSPDFTYILDTAGLDLDAHSLEGIFLFCLPVSWLLLLLYEGCLKTAWESLLPWLAYDRGQKSWLVTSTSIVMGAATHVIWDGFTHKSGFGILMFPSLNGIVVEWHHYRLHLFHALQYLSSLLGALILVIAVMKRVKSMPEKRFVSSWKDVMAVALGTAILTGIFLIVAPRRPQRGVWNHTEFWVMKSAMRMLAAMLVVVVAFPFLKRGK